MMFLIVAVIIALAILGFYMYSQNAVVKKNYPNRSKKPGEPSKVLKWRPREKASGEDSSDPKEPH